MARAFIASSSINKTRMPAAAFSAKAACGREIQLNTWIGRTVNCDQILSGTNGIYVSAPIVISGAVSPMARDSARITPVRIPGSAAGRT